MKITKELTRLEDAMFDAPIGGMLLLIAKQIACTWWRDDALTIETHTVVTVICTSEMHVILIPQQCTQLITGKTTDDTYKLT